MSPKKRTSGNGERSGGGKKQKSDLPSVPADALALPHMVIFDAWVTLDRETLMMYLRMCLWCDNFKNLRLVVLRNTHLKDVGKTIDVFLNEKLKEPVLSLEF